MMLTTFFETLRIEEKINNGHLVGLTVEEFDQRLAFAHAAGFDGFDWKTIEGMCCQLMGFELSAAVFEAWCTGWSRAGRSM